MKAVVVLLLSAGLVACDARTTDDKEAGGVVPDYQMQALEKARGVEQSLRDAEQSRRGEE